MPDQVTVPLLLPPLFPPISGQSVAPLPSTCTLLCSCAYWTCAQHLHLPGPGLVPLLAVYLLNTCNCYPLHYTSSTPVVVGLPPILVLSW